jgi:hypothetical protein
MLAHSQFNRVGIWLNNPEQEGKYLSNLDKMERKSDLSGKRKAEAALKAGEKKMKEMQIQLPATEKKLDESQVNLFWQILEHITYMPAGPVSNS